MQHAGLLSFLCQKLHWRSGTKSKHFCKEDWREEIQKENKTEVWSPCCQALDRVVMIIQIVTIVPSLFKHALCWWNRNVWIAFFFFNCYIIPSACNLFKYFASKKDWNWTWMAKFLKHCVGDREIPLLLRRFMGVYVMYCFEKSFLSFTL